MKRLGIALVAFTLGCAGGGSTEPAVLPDGGYLLRIEEPTIGSGRDTTEMRVTQGTIDVFGGVAAGNVAIRSYFRASGDPACSGQPRSCWSRSWTASGGNPLTTTATVSGTSLTLAFQVVYLFSAAPPAARAYRLSPPYALAYDSSSAGVYELRRQ